MKIATNQMERLSHIPLLDGRVVLLLCSLLLLVVLLTGCGTQPLEASVETTSNAISGDPEIFVVLISHTDHIKIGKVHVNRGNCRIMGWIGHDTLGFGGQVKAQIEAPPLGCAPDAIQEVSVDTDAGAFTFTF